MNKHEQEVNKYLLEGFENVTMEDLKNLPTITTIPSGKTPKKLGEPPLSTKHAQIVNGDAQLIQPMSSEKRDFLSNFAIEF